MKVIDSDEVNAFALPGGFFYVNSGLILEADEEAELAWVMAHEIAHVAARHGTEQYSKAELFNYASIPLIFVGGPVGYGVRPAAGLLVPLQFLQFSRAAETEADIWVFSMPTRPATILSPSLIFSKNCRLRKSASQGSCPRPFPHIRRPRIEFRSPNRKFRAFCPIVTSTL